VVAEKVSKAEEIMVGGEIMVEEGATAGEGVMVGEVMDIRIEEEVVVVAIEDIKDCRC
jgi:ribosomal 50S subunit-recycling heat shock protein